MTWLLGWGTIYLVSKVSLCPRNILCSILVNLSGYIDKRLLELNDAVSDPFKAVLLKKEILDILRVRSFRHRNCCSTFLDITSLQIGFELQHGLAVRIAFEFFSMKAYIPLKIAGHNIYAFATEALIYDEAICERFCQSSINSSTITQSEVLAIFNDIRDIDASNQHPIEVSEDSLLARYILNSQKGILSLVTKSTIELSLLKFELSRLEGFRVRQEFEAFSLHKTHETFVQYRKRIYTLLSQLSRKIVDVNLTFTLDDQLLLDSYGLRHELEQSIFVGVYFVYELLLQAPSEFPDLQVTFEKFVAPSFHWLLTYLDNYNQHDQTPYSDFYLTKSLELLTSLLALDVYKLPEHFKREVYRLEDAIVRFSTLDPAPEYKTRHAYITDMGRFYVAKIEGTEFEIRKAPSTARFPDLDLLQSKNYLILTTFGSSDKLLYKCLDQVSRNVIVVKRIAKQSQLGESRYLTTLNDVNIVRYLDCFAHGSYSFMVMEYCENKIVPISAGQVTLTEDEVLKTCRPILSGLSYLHWHHIIHRDIKPSNILKDGRGFVKIADFGEAQIYSPNGPLRKFDLRSLYGTAAYMAPECMHSSSVTYAADIWSFGCLIVYLLTGKHPWNQCDNEMSIPFRLGATEELPVDYGSLSCSQALKDVLRQIFTRTPKDRPSAVELLRLPLFYNLSGTII